MPWIKIETSTPNKPEIRAAARACGISRAEAFMAFFTTWAYFDEHCSDGFIGGLIPEDVDEISGVKGFGNALADVGWLAFDRSGMTIANWSRHNGTSAKQRSLTLNRVQTLRAKARWGNA